MTEGLTPRTPKVELEVKYIGPAPLPDEIAAEIGRGEHYMVGECNIIQTDKRHFTISHPERYPTWDEIAAARYALLPSLRDCVLLLPPHDEYVNVHENCFHVHLLRELGPGGRFHNSHSW
jgi:hypothetical protein